MKQTIINKTILFSGIGLYLFGFVAILFSALVFNKHDNFQQPILEVFTFLPPLIVFAFTIIYASIFEEIAFRGWIIKRKIWKHISLSLIVFIVYYSFENILVAIISGAVLFIVFYKIKDEKHKLVLSVLSTSLLFGIIHYANYTSWGRLFAIIQLVGFSFIICYLGLRFGFIFCILGHFINNLLAMLMLTLFISKDYSGEFSNKTYSAEITKVSLFDMSRDFNYGGFDTLTYNGNITQIAELLTDFENSTFYKSQISSLIKYRLIATANPDHKIDRKELLTDFLKHTGLKTDTTYEPAYILLVTDSLRLTNPNVSDKNLYKNYLFLFMQSIYNIYKLPVMLAEELYYYEILIYTGLFDHGIILDNEAAFAEFKNRLSNEYSIEIVADSTELARIITFKE